MTVSVRVEGLKEMDRALGELPKRVAKTVLRRVLIKAAKPVLDDARARAPELSGELKASFAAGTKLSRRQRRVQFRLGKAFQEVYVGPGTNPQAITQEFGAINHPAQPFMRPAWEANKRRSLEIIKDELWDEIEKAVKRVAAGAARRAAKIKAMG